MKKRVNNEQLLCGRSVAVLPDFFELCIVALYSFYAFINIMRVTQINEIPGVFQIIIYCNYLILFALGCMLLLIGKLKSNVAITCVILLIIGCIIAKKNDELVNTLIIVMFVALGWKVRSDLLFKSYCVIAFIVVFMTVTFSLIGIYDNSYTYVWGRGYRHTLGFNYTTYAPNFLFHISLAYFFVKKKIKITDTIMIMLFNVVLMYYTDTRAVFFELTALLLIMWLYRFFPKLFKTKIFRILTSIIMPCLAIGMFWLSYNYKRGSRIFRELNTLLSGRLGLGHKAIGLYGLPLFGTDVEWVTNTVNYEGQYFYVDSSYLNAMFTFGIIFTLVIIFSFSVLGNKAHRADNISLCIVIMFLSVHSFSDPQLMELRYDPFLLLLGKAWFDYSYKIELKSSRLFHIPKPRLVW